jgi:hypothetical protein
VVGFPDILNNLGDKGRYIRFLPVEFRKFFRLEELTTFEVI